MTKYYCDLCGREVQGIEEYTLPIFKDKEYKDTRGNVIRKGYVFMPTKMELCNDCRRVIGSFVHIIKQAPATTWIDKTITKIEWE